MSFRGKAFETPPTRPCSPSMFDETMVSLEVFTQSTRIQGYNQVISNKNEQLSPSPPHISKNLSVIFPLTSRSHQTNAIVLSNSRIERVTTGRLCDNINHSNHSNQCTDNHNRSVTDVAETTLYSECSFVGSVVGSSPKRPRLDEPIVPNVSLTLNSSLTKASAETSDMLERLFDATKAINDQLVSLHADCGNHLRMVNNIISTMDV